MKQLIIVESQTSLLFWKQSSSSSLLFSLSLSTLASVWFSTDTAKQLTWRLCWLMKEGQWQGFFIILIWQKKVCHLYATCTEVFWGGLWGNRVAFGLWGLSKASLAISYNSLFEKRNHNRAEKNFFDVLGKLETNWVLPDTYKIGQVSREIFKQSF